MKGNNYFFDCDGVVLDSNKIKTRVFTEICDLISKEMTAEFVKYHKKNGGISRYKKFEYLYFELLGVPDRKLVAEASEKFHKLVVEALIEAPFVAGVKAFIEQLSCNKDNNLFIVSGGDQSELRHIFKMKGFDKHFREICGSPRDKISIIKEIYETYAIKDGVYFGDSILDIETAKYFNHKFCFVYGYSELQDWKVHVANNNSPAIRNFLKEELLQVSFLQLI